MTNTFTINQTPTSANIYMYPNGYVKDGLSRYGTASNYMCVDELFDVIDNDTTYVYTTSTSVVSDLYLLPNQTASGTINSVRVFSTAKSYQYLPSGSAIYKIMINDGTSSKFSDNFNLTTDYSTNYYLWTSNPTDSSTWTWADINNIRIGVQCNSPTISGYPTTTIFRPNADVSHTKWYDKTSGSEVGPFWSEIDEEVADDLTSYIYTIDTSSGWVYNDIPDHTTETGTITSISLFWRGRKSVSAWGTGFICPSPWTNNYYVGNYATQLTEDFTTFYENWTSNPTNSSAWQWKDIDQMRIGTYGRDVSGDGVAYCTQEYLVVNHLGGTGNPEIRTTSLYAVVNYTPSSSTCYLNYPSTYSLSNDVDVKKINSWSGDRHVYSLGRTGRVLTLSGSEWGSTATSRLHCVDLMKDNASEITLSGFDDLNLNTTWMIRDFTHENSAENLNMYNWVLTLEKT